MPGYSIRGPSQPKAYPEPPVDRAAVRSEWFRESCPTSTQPGGWLVPETSGRAQGIAKLKFAFQQYEHRIGRVALPRVGFSSLEVHFLRVTQEPVDVIVRQTVEDRNFP